MRHEPTSLDAAFAAMLGPIVRAEVREALADREHALEDDVPRVRLLSVKQLAEALGSSPSTVHRMMDRGCPHFYVMESPRFDLSEVLAWLPRKNREHAVPNEGNSAGSEEENDATHGNG